MDSAQGREECEAGRGKGVRRILHRGESSVRRGVMADGGCECEKEPSRAGQNFSLNVLNIK